MDYLIRKLLDSFGIFFRTIKAFFSRRLAGGVARVKQLTNFSRHATKVANASFQGVAAAVKKPTKREDYIETQRLFISKSFIVFLVVGIVLVALFCWFVAWPFILSHFMTAKFYVRDDRVSDWTGKVIVYSDKSKKTPMYSGKLENGLLQGQGKEYDEEGLLEYEGAFVDGVRTGSGKSYASGVLIYEGSFEHGQYQGSGTLYEEGMPLYEGRFEEGIYEGTGTLYDGGTVIYEGQFHEGVYEGTGKLYSEGSLIYNGQFHEGLYEGNGTTYQDGKPEYKGTFTAGVPEGSGTLYENGVKRYEGDFSEGLFDGEGKLFFPDGTLEYKGGFAAGVYDGEGTEYREDGSVAYSGGYEDGKTSGEGTVTLENGDKIEASFTDGIGDGMITWNKNGRVWYEGGADDLTPDGFGTLYAQSGKPVYEGAMDEGSIDGAWLLTLSANELREAFAEASVTESEYDSGFLITNNDLGLTALCTMRSEDGDPGVSQIWLFPDAGSQSAQLISWSTREQAESWAVKDKSDAAIARSVGSVSVPDGANGEFPQSVAICEGYSQTLVCRDEGSAPFGVIWTALGGLIVPPSSTVDEAVSDAQRELEGLFDALDKVTAAREPTGDNSSDDESSGGSGGVSGGGSGGVSGGGSGGVSGGGTGTDPTGSPSGNTGSDPGGGSGGTSGGGSSGSSGSGTGGNPGGGTSGNPSGGSGGSSGNGTGENPGSGTGGNPGGGSSGNTGSGTGENPGGGTSGNPSGGSGVSSGSGTGENQGGGTSGSSGNGSSGNTGSGTGENQGGGTSGNSGGGSGGSSGNGTSGSSGNGSSGNTGSGTGENPGSGTGGDPGSGSGGSSGSGSGENPGGGTGSDPGSGSGGNTGTGSGENTSGETSGSTGGESSGSSGSGSGENTGGTGENPGGGSGENSGDTGGNTGGGSGENQSGGGTGENSGGTGSNSGGTSGGGYIGPAANVEELLSRAKDMDQATKLMEALINYFAYSQSITSLKAERPLRVKLLEEQIAQRDKGLGSDDAVNELQDSLDDLDHQLYQYNVMLEQANITVETLTGTNVKRLDLSNVLLAVNMSSVNVDRLYANVLQYSKDLAAEQYEVDPSEILVDVKVKLLDLTIAYDNIEQGRSTLASSRETLEKITKSYHRGQAEKADVYAAQCTVNDSVASLFQTMASYTRTFNDLNNKSGGWLAREYGWYPKPFASLKEKSIAKAWEEAKKSSKDSEEDGEDSGQTDGGTGEQGTTA